MLSPIRTPLLQFPPDPRILVKPESLQPFGSYKIRGVSCLLRTSSAGVSFAAASAGNMGQAVAAFARERGARCRIFVPVSAPEVKKRAIRALGAELIERPFAEIWEMVRRPPETDGEIFVHPAFSSPLLDGYGRIVEEIFEDAGDIEALVVPFGVGGPALGMARALERCGRGDVALYACEPETAAPLALSLASGRPCGVKRKASFIDALGTPEVLPEVYARLAPRLAGSLVMSIEETRAAMRELLVAQKLVCEGAAGVSLAAAKRLTRERGYRRVACVLTGGNLESSELSHLISGAI